MVNWINSNQYTNLDLPIFGCIITKSDFKNAMNRINATLVERRIGCIEKVFEINLLASKYFSRK